MMNLKRNISLIVLCYGIAIYGCGESKKADLVLRDANIYTMNQNAPTVQAVAVSNGKIVAVGTNAAMEPLTGEDTEVLSLNGKTVVPGFIESHGHMMSLGNSMMRLDLTGTRNYDELVAKVKQAMDRVEPGQWILGRGWHQSKWMPQPKPMIKGFQTHHKLSAISPQNPIFLTHASGHAGFANARAMEIAGITSESTFGGEGEIIKDENGEPTGIFNEVAQNLIWSYISKDTVDTRSRALELAIDECLRHGVTTFHDAGAGRSTIEIYYDFLNQGKLRVRLYVMLTGREPLLLDDWYGKGPEIGLGDNFLTIRAIKLNTDGALGSRGAWLLDEYNDREGHYGMATQPMTYVHEVAEKGLRSGFQVNAHAIGDRAVREVLDQYEDVFNKYPEKAGDHRFRIEHAQHIDPQDLPRFNGLGVIASVQAIHMSSDRPWAIDRLGKKRIEEGAYVWRKLIDSGAVVINGTDVPVEPISPIECFYASVTRRTLEGEPPGGYEPHQKMVRQEALKSYTLSAAYGAFEEDLKGSIEVGKVADFAVLSQDMMTVDEDAILDTEILYTIVNGKIEYHRADGKETETGERDD